MRNVKGYVRGYDARTGKRLWIFHTIPQRGQFGYDTWLEGSAEFNGNTGVWAQMSADAERGLVYVPVEMPTGDYYGGNRPGDNLFANSLIAIDARTGKSILSFGNKGVVNLREGLGRDPKTVFRAQSSNPGKIFENLIILGSATSEVWGAPPGSPDVTDDMVHTVVGVVASVRMMRRAARMAGNDTIARPVRARDRSATQDGVETSRALASCGRTAIASQSTEVSCECDASVVGRRCWWRRC